MKRNTSHKGIFLLLLLCFLIFSTMLQAQNFDHIKNRIKEFTLENGMKFIVFERHDAPVVSFTVYADVGSANETYGITGISHLLEHMAFKGTKTVGTKDYEKEAPLFNKIDMLYDEINREKAKARKDTALLKELESKFNALREEAKSLVVNNELIDLFLKNGDRSVNAMTSNDATRYINSLPSNRLEFWMAATSDRFMNPVFREFYKEKEVVMEERRLSLETQPTGRLIEDFCATAFKAHPYHHSVVGHMSDLIKITRQDVRDYFKKYYCPSNLIVGIAGDVKPAEVFQMAEKYFGRIPSGPKPLPPRTEEPEQWGERRVEVVAQSQPIVIIGYHRPAVNHEDDAALGALANIVGQGRSSWLYEIMVKEKKIAIQTGVFNGFPGSKYPNLIAFLAVPAKGHTSEECIKVIDEQIERLKKESVSEEELTKYKRTTKKGLIQAMKSNMSMTMNLTEAEAIYGDWREFFNSLDKVDAVTADDVKRVASKYLIRKNRTIGEIVPEDEATK